ncbi:MAG TPA: carboxypeptidase-like regulatory domain-containing protein, partial [Terriglobales bacterium]
MAFLLMAASGLGAQEITSTIVGSVTDSSGAVVPGAAVKLTDVNTNAVRTAQTGRDGVFHFPNLDRGTYKATVTANGFQAKTITGIILDASSTRDLGKVAMTVGSVSQEVTVTAAATPIQTSSSEVSHTIQGSELDSLPLVGRDVFGALQLDAGVVSRPGGGNFGVTSSGDIGAITIDGNTQAINLTVDGVTAVDTGSNGSTHSVPNFGAVQEVKILSSNYDAEYGRMSGGTITLVTKSGGNAIHGQLWADHRHEEFNANTWANNHNNLPRPQYRFNILGYDVGGPVPFGWLKNRLFWFASEEWTNQLGDNTVEQRTTPTPAEEGLVGSASCPKGSADFSGLVNGKGKPIALWNPVAGAGFPGNCIPQSMISPQGLAMLEFFPQPNFTPAAGSTLVNQANFEQQASAAQPLRNDVLRFDFNPTSKLTSYFRWLNTHNVVTSLFNAQQFNIAPVNHPNSGHGYVWSATYVLSPTLINTTTVGKNWDTYSWNFLSGGLAQVSRGTPLSPTLNPPTLFPMPTTPAATDQIAPSANGYANLLPAMSFGSDLPNMMSLGTATAPYYNSLNVYTVDDDVSKVVGPHQLKMGIYVEYNTKLQPAGNGYSGNYSF